MFRKCHLLSLNINISQWKLLGQIVKDLLPIIWGTFIWDFYIRDKTLAEIRFKKKWGPAQWFHEVYRQSDSVWAGSSVFGSHQPQLLTFGNTLSCCTTFKIKKQEWIKSIQNPLYIWRFKVIVIVKIYKKKLIFFNFP